MDDNLKDEFDKIKKSVEESLKDHIGNADYTAITARAMVDSYAAGYYSSTNKNVLAVGILTGGNLDMQLFEVDDK